MVERRTVEGVNASHKKQWSKKWSMVVPKNYVLLRRHIFGSITASVVDIDKSREEYNAMVADKYQCISNGYIRGGSDNPPKKAFKALVDITDSELEEYINYYSRTSRKNYLAIAKAEQLYREYLRNNKVSSPDDYISAIKDRAFIEDLKPSLRELIENPLTNLYSRVYANDDIREIPAKKAKLGLKIRLPFQSFMLISTNEREIDTVKVSISEQRSVSFDVNPIITISDPQTYVEKLQTENYKFDERLLAKDIGSRVNSIFSEYFISRGVDSFSDEETGRTISTDPDLLWDLTVLGIEFGVKFHPQKFRVRRYNSEEVLKANDYKKSLEIKTKEEKQRYNELAQQGITPQMAFLAGDGNAKNGSKGAGNVLETALGMMALDKLGNGGLFGGNQQQNNPQPRMDNPTVTASGYTIDQLHDFGVCDEEGKLDFDTINYVLALRGVAEGDEYMIEAKDLNSEEAFKVYTKNKPRRK